MLHVNLCDNLFLTEKKDLSPSEEWGVDQQLISKLKEQYKKERKGKKGIQSMNGCSCSYSFSFWFAPAFLIHGQYCHSVFLHETGQCVADLTDLMLE